PHLAGGPGQFLAEAAHGVPDVLADLADDVADGRGQFLFELIELVPPVSQLLAAGLGDPVDLAPVFLVVRDQALFLEAGEPRVDGARGGGVHAHEAVAQQPDYLIAVPGLLVEQAQQVQPKASMAENRGHWVLLSIPTGARRNSVTVPDMVVTDTCPVPAPTLPLTVCEAGALTVRSDSNSVLTPPDLECRCTCASLSAGSRSVTSPDIVVTRTLPLLPSETSAVTCPLSVSTARDSTEPPASVSPPDIDLKWTSPSMSQAATSPDIVSAETSPVTPSSVMSPDMPLTAAPACRPVTTAEALSTPSWIRQSAGTVIVTAALSLRGFRNPSSPSQDSDS